MLARMSADPITRLNAALEGRYRVERELGEGGMATVYLADDLKHERKVALKVLKPELAAVVGAERFLAEIKTTANLQHPHILPLFDSGEADGFLYYVMPYVEGETLRDRLERGGPLPLDDTVRIVGEIADALDHAHARGIVHRDVKPANVLLSGGRVLVADFGIALALGAAGGKRFTETGMSLGTPSYMSPKQASGERAVDARSDVYALAAVTYEMLAGVPPHTGSTLQAIIAKILTETPTTIRKTRARIPEHIDDAVLRSLEAIPGDRHQTPGALAAALRQPATMAAAGGLWRFLAVGAASAVAASVITWSVLGVSASGGAAPPPMWDRRPLTATGDASAVSLSPDGQMVTYLTSEGLVTQDISGGDPNLILSAPRWLGALEMIAPGRPNGEPQWLTDGSSVAYTQPVDSVTLGIFTVPRMGGQPVPVLTRGFTGGEVTAQIQPLEGSSFLLARSLENSAAAPWIRFEPNSVWLDPPPDIVDLWDAVAAPDGSWIAYIGERDDRTTVVGTISRDGSTHNVLLEGGTELSKWAEISMAPQWAGNRIMRWSGASTVFYRSLTLGGSDLYSFPIDLATGRAVGDPELVLTDLPLGAGFDITSDGSRIVYSGGPVRTQVHLFRFDPDVGGEPVESRQITSGTARHTSPRISPDGRQLAYIRKVGGSEDIYVVPIAGGAPRRLPIPRRWTRLIEVKWSPQEGDDRLAVLAETEKGAELFIVSTSEVREPRVVETPPVRGTWFDWSPDASRIAHARSDDEVYMVQDLETGDVFEVFADLPGEKIQALFSPDGRELLVNAIDIGAQGLWVAEIEGGGDSRLLTDEIYGRTFPMRWSADGRIWVLGLDGTVLIVDAEDGTVTLFGQLPGGCVWDGWASISEDGRYLACTMDETRESDVWVADRIEGS